MPDKKIKHRFERRSARSLRWDETPSEQTRPGATNVIKDCGWGRLIFGHTFDSNEALAEALTEEKPEQRDIGLYLRDPHVVLSLAPQELFLDPSHTYRLWFSAYRPPKVRHGGFTIRFLQSKQDARDINRLYKRRNMVPTDTEFVWNNRASRDLIYLIAEDNNTGQAIGTVTGVDHKAVFDDPEDGSSLWCLAVDPDTQHPGVGMALVTTLAEHFMTRGRAHMDLSVLHDNTQAIALYEKTGFARVPVFCIKRKNPINQNLFIGPDVQHQLNPYAAIIVDEARRRGISVDILDEKEGYFRLRWGGRAVTCRESLTELTHAIALSRCDHKRLTHDVLSKAGLKVPEQIVADDDKTNLAFMQEHGSIVVKPARGEQGRGISADVSDEDELEEGLRNARRYCDEVLLEKRVSGDDLRIVVINHEVVAAALRRPAMITGNGRDTVGELIRKLSRRRSAATQGESRIPMDEETRRCIAKAGYDMDDIPEKGLGIHVRSTANLHTGGTLHDVTDRLHPELGQAAVRAAQALDIPVVGIDLMVSNPEQPDYAIIEANERVGLANHEPQPTAQRFIDFLFPETSHRTQNAFALADSQDPADPTGVKANPS